jgi:ribonuclease P protein component
MPTFHRSERLRSRKLIERLFREGQSFVAFPLRVVWIALTEKERTAAGFEASPAQVAFSVPKRAYKSAVTRNRIRRQMREAYRQHKALLYEHLYGRSLHIALLLIFIAKEEPSSSQLVKSMLKVARFFSMASHPLSAGVDAQANHDL